MPPASDPPLKPYDDGESIWRDPCDMAAAELTAASQRRGPCSPRSGRSASTAPIVNIEPGQHFFGRRIGHDAAGDQQGEKGDGENLAHGKVSQIGEKKNRSHEIRNRPNPAELNRAGDQSKIAAERAPPDRRGAERAAIVAAAASRRENPSIDAVFADAEVVQFR
jgi:hypothetical protein